MIEPERKGNESASASNSVTVTSVSIPPSPATVEPFGEQTFTANSGSGTGYAWSLITNASWGYINSSSGAYTAGPFSSVTDVVQVADSLGNLATVCVSVGGGACPL